MASTRKKRALTKSIPESVAAGALMSLTLSGLAILLISGLVIKEKMKYETINYATMAVYVFSGFVGAIFSRSFANRKTLLVCLASGALYFCFLLAITASFFGGQYDGAGVTLLAIFLGCIAAAFASRGMSDRIKRRSI